MKTFFILVIGLTFVSLVNAATPQATQLHCNKNNVPKIIKPMENWEIVADNTATIKSATVFSGDKLTYTFSAHPKNVKNIVTINKATGVIEVKAEKKDNFDITVKASNLCGTISNTFNVVIDEDE